MTIQQAVTIVRDTFESAFDKQRFTFFIKNLLNTIEDAPVTFKYVPDRFKPYISHFERIGKYFNDKDRIDILVVHLKKETSIERARSTQRNFVAGYLQGDYGTTSNKNAALVAFESPASEDWRFSLVCLDYSLEESSSGKIKAKSELTPARRWSFLVGRHENSHTAQRKLAPIMADDEHNPTLSELEDAFNIEKVTKEFFEKYRGLFIGLKEALDKVIRANPIAKSDLEDKGVNSVDFSKKLLGQIIFLYFLQRKGWFGVPRDSDWGSGSKQFLRELFEKTHGEYKNFFNDILEPLFYDALRTDRSHDNHYYTLFKCKIPFLNGGLFDPMNNYDWVHTDILLPNDLFSNSNKTKEGDIGDGILDIFDRYNFTVREDEPYEKEVAIDPELLGKAYEKFNAIRPDNFEEFQKTLKSGKKGDESKFNKQYGVYYTPREIVHYMCQQSLVNYLDNEVGGIVAKAEIEALILHGEKFIENDLDALDKEKKVESGQQKATTSKSLISENIRVHAALLDEKLADIKVCDPAVGSGAFPVGMMTEIIKSRITLAVYTQKQKTIYALKRECIENSLYGVDIDAGAVEITKLRLWLSLVVDEDDIRNIKPLPNLDYKIMCGDSLLGFPEGIILDPEIKSKLEERKRDYFGVTNPNEKLMRRLEINDLFTKLVTSAKQYDPSLGKINFDFQTHFSEVFFKKSGFDIVIANPPYIDSERMVNSGQMELRKLITRTYKFTKGNWDIYIAFFERGFSVLNASGILAYITPDKWISKPFGDSLRLSKFENLLLILKAGRQVFEDAKVDAIVSLFTSIKCDSLQVQIYDESINHKYTIQKKCLKPPFALDKLFSSSLDLIQKLDEAKTNLISNFLCENACSTSDAYKLKPYIQEMTSNLNDSEYFLKIVNTGTIGKYFSKWGLQQMTYLGNQYLYPCVNKEVFFRNFKNSYSKKTLRPKLIIKGLNLLDSFLDLSGEVLPGKTTLIVTNSKNDTDELKFVLSILNSSLIFHYIKEKYSSSSYNQGISFTTEMINNIPIEENQNIKKKINNLVDRIILSKNENHIQNTKYFETQIDRLVYELYDLSEEEIAIVEGKA